MMYTQQLQQQQHQQLAGGQMDSKSSPSKAAAKFATKQEIANTYMNKTEAFQKYRLMQNGTPVQQQQVMPGYDDTNENISTSTSSSLNANNNSQPASSSSTSSSVASINSPLGHHGHTTHSNNPHQQQQQQQHNNIPGDSSFNQSINSNNNNETSSTSTTLPSHLKLEFDKMKYLPDMVKTIKKRHSISEIEGSGNTIPPLIVQKLLEKHKEFNSLNHQR